MHVELIANTKSSIEKADYELMKIDKELDQLKMEGKQQRKTAESAGEEAAVAIKEVEKLEQEKQLLIEEIKKKERELGYFKGFRDQLILTSEREKEDLQESIKAKENELQEAKAKLKDKERKLEKCKEKIQKLKKWIEEAVKELGLRNGQIIQLENEKAKMVADLESEKMKVRVLKQPPSEL